MKIKALMTKDVTTVAPDTPLREVARLLAEKRISGLPVVKDERVVGVISEADILAKERGSTHGRRRLLDLLFDGRTSSDPKLEATIAGEAMSAPAVTIGPESPVAEAAATMLDRLVNRLPVVDREGRLIGIVTRADLVRAFVRTDEDLKQEITEDVIRRALWIAPETVGVAVESGAVTLSGRVENRATAEMLPRFVQRVPGVVSVSCDVGWEDGNGRRS